jgi:DNA polymerase III delta subunit
MKSVVSKLKSSLINTTDIATKAIESVSKESNAMLDSDAIQKLKEQTKNAVKTSIAVCKNLGDVNGDGKIDREHFSLEVLQHLGLTPFQWLAKLWPYRPLRAQQPSFLLELKYQQYL